MSNPTSRKYPRTMQEAFGPHTSRQIEEPYQDMDWQDKVVVTASIVTLVVVLILSFTGVIA